MHQSSCRVANRFEWRRALFMQKVLTNIAVEDSSYSCWRNIVISTPVHSFVMTSPPMNWSPVLADCCCAVRLLICPYIPFCLDVPQIV